jgi:hypothetical protein
MKYDFDMIIEQKTRITINGQKYSFQDMLWLAGLPLSKGDRPFRQG